MLAQACASTAMIYAMHQIQVACIDEHGSELAWQQTLLAQLAGKQWLLASATSEETIGGNMRTSACAVEIDAGDGKRFASKSSHRPSHTARTPTAFSSPRAARRNRRRPIRY